MKLNVENKIAPPRNEPYPAMVRVNGGKFLIGSLSYERGRLDSENCQREVHLEDFDIGKYPVTFAEYDAFCRATDRKKPYDEGWGRGRMPVINVSWYDATAYCEWLSSQTGEEYRLPTEEEWEYACRAGTLTPYFFGDDFTKLDDYAWYHENSNHKPHPVGEKLPNQLWLYDVYGNVWEWTASEYKGEDAKYGIQYMVRGGSWYSEPYGLRSDSSNYWTPYGRSNFGGFRLARTPKKPRPFSFYSSYALNWIKRILRCTRQ